MGDMEACSQLMLKTASRSRELLEPDAVLQIADFVLSRLSDTGGFKGRADSADLYYTVFGLDSLLALGKPVPSDHIQDYIGRFGTDEQLDLVHLACLARCNSRLADESPDAWKAAVANRIETCRSHDGGYALNTGSEQASAYACFLAVSAYEDLGLSLHSTDSLSECVVRLQPDNTGNPSSSIHTTPTVAAAVVVLSQLGRKPTTQTVDWLLARHDPQTGGFFAAQDAPLPDLLSTATALFTLSLMNIPIDNLRSQSTEFVQLLWDDTGGFCGSPADTVPDCEYTFYALLALGCLGVRRKDEG